jgi:hypothetical protein
MRRRIAGLHFMAYNFVRRTGRSARSPMSTWRTLQIRVFVASEKDPRQLELPV